jgi:hypothetical protein
VRRARLAGAALAVYAAVPASAQKVTLPSLAGKYCGRVPGFDERSSYIHHSVEMELTLSPDGGYRAFLGRGDAAPVGQVSGTFSLSDATLRLRPGLVGSIGPKGPAPVAPAELRVVRWGARTYLVPPESLAAFCKTKPEHLDSCPFWSLVKSDDLRKPRGPGPPC